MTIQMIELSPAEETVAELKSAVLVDSCIEVEDAIQRALVAAIRTLSARLHRSGGPSATTSIRLRDADRRTGAALADLVCESLMTDLPCDVKAIVKQFDEHDVANGDEELIDRVTSHANSVLKGLCSVG